MLFVSDVAVFVLTRDIKLQPTSQPTLCCNGEDGDSADVWGVVCLLRECRAVVSYATLQRRKLCESLIERDDKFRQSAGLSTPSLDDIRAMKRVKLVTGVNRKSLLTRLGVLERRRPTYGRRDGGDRGGGYDRRKRSVGVCVKTAALCHKTWHSRCQDTVGVFESSIAAQVVQLKEPTQTKPRSHSGHAGKSVNLELDFLFISASVVSDVICRY